MFEKLNKPMDYRFILVIAGITLLVVMSWFWSADLTKGAQIVGVEATVTTTISCPVIPSTTTFGTLSTTAIHTSSPNATTTLSSNYGGGATLSIQDAYAGLYQAAHTITSTDATLPSGGGSEGYGVEATTTEVTLGTINLASKYAKWGNDDVGGLATSTVTLATSSAAVVGKVLVRHKTTISATTTSGSYTDQITYSCSGTP